MARAREGDPDPTTPSEPIFRGELRDTERAIRLWNRKASELGRPPPASAFNVLQLATDTYAFFICADLLAKEDSVFVLYGASFARLFGLPERVSTTAPMIRQIPPRYQPLFVEGCEQAIREMMPVRFSGAVVHDANTELYRASFMPLRMQSQSLQFIFGSFNYRRIQDFTTRDRAVAVAEHRSKLRHQAGELDEATGVPSDALLSDWRGHGRCAIHLKAAEMPIPDDQVVALAELSGNRAQAWLQGMCSYERAFVMAILRALPDYRYEPQGTETLPPGLPSAIAAVEAAIAQLEAGFEEN